MRIPYLAMILCFLSLTGCSSLIFPSSSQPEYYLLDYKPSPVQCPHRFGMGVRAWEFAAASPYDGREMVVIGKGGKITPSRDFQWAAPPGEMVSDAIFRDLNRSSLFPAVLTGGEPGSVPLDMTGRILVFAWQRDGDTSRPVLDLEVSLIRKGASAGEIFHENYSLKGEQIKGEGTSEDFVRSMSSLVAEASGRIGRDLCRRAGMPDGH